MFFFFDMEDDEQAEELVKYSEQTFEDIRHVNEYGQEYWLGRELSQILQYADWRNFENAIFKAMDACKTSGNKIADHFGDVTTFTKNEHRFGPKN